MESLIIPAIQVDKFKDLQDKLNKARGVAERVQIDVVGEEFADSKTIGVEELARANTSLIMEIQLMVKEPIRYLNRCDVVGIERVYGHVEQMSDQEEFVESASDMGMQVGLGLDIHTPVMAIEKVLPYLDGALLMSVEVGFSGQGFDEGVFDKIAELRERDFKGDICVDGGLNRENIEACREKGANHFAVNSTLWKAKDFKKMYQVLKQAT